MRTLPPEASLMPKVTVWLTSETTPEQFGQLAQLCVEEEYAHAFAAKEHASETRDRMEAAFGDVLR